MNDHLINMARDQHLERMSSLAGEIHRPIRTRSAGGHRAQAWLRALVQDLRSSTLPRPAGPTAVA